MTGYDYYEFERKTELCSIATDMRLLGFSEQAIKKWLKEMSLKDLRQMLDKYSMQADLYGDSAE